MTSPLAGPAHLLVTGAATAVAVVFGVVAALRRSKPLHPRGVVRRGTLTVRPAIHATGVPMLDSPGTHDCIVRTSRAIGLPPPLPDVHGLALRIQVRGDTADLLSAGTGSGPVARHVVVPRRASSDGPMSTLIPMRSPTGPLLLRVSPTAGDRQDPRSFDLAWARPGRPWSRFGTLVVGEKMAKVPDPPVRFDTVLHPIPSLDHYPLVRALREPSYAWARRGWPQSGLLMPGSAAPSP